MVTFSTYFIPLQIARWLLVISLSVICRKSGRSSWGKISAIRRELGVKSTFDACGSGTLPNQQLRSVSRISHELRGFAPIGMHYLQDFSVLPQSDTAAMQISQGDL